MGRGHVGHVTSIAAVAAAALAVAIGPAGAAAASVPWRPVVAGSVFHAGAEPVAYVARTAAGTRRFSRSLDPADAARAAAVDFGRFVVVAVVAPFPSCGWRVQVRGIDRVQTALRVRYAARGPVKGAPVCQAETTVYAVVRVARPLANGVVRAVPVRVE